VALSYLLPKYGHLKLKSITPLQLRSVIDEMAHLGRSAATISTYVGTYASLFTAAVDSDVLLRSPVRRKQLVAGAEKIDEEHVHLAPDELRHLSNAFPERFRSLVFLAGAVGLRWSEAIALRNVDLDLDDGPAWLSVAQTVEEVGGYAKVVPATKSDASRRRIAIPDIVRDDLLAHRAMHRPDTEPTDLLFVGARGGLLRRSFGRRFFDPAVAEVGLPDSLTFHGLRHVAATYLEEINAPLRVRQHRLGHSAQGVTLRVYTHVPERLDREISDRLQILLEPAR
jgi:integrase